MHSKRRFNIFCSVILGELQSFRNYKGFSIIFPKTLDAISSITKLRRYSRQLKLHSEFYKKKELEEISIYSFKPIRSKEYKK